MDQLEETAGGRTSVPAFSFAPTHCENLGYHRTVSASIKLGLVTSKVPSNSSTPGPLGKINTKCGQGWKSSGQGLGLRSAPWTL